MDTRVIALSALVLYLVVGSSLAQYTRPVHHGLAAKGNHQLHKRQSNDLNNMIGLDDRVMRRRTTPHRTTRRYPATTESTADLAEERLTVLESEESTGSQQNFTTEHEGTLSTDWATTQNTTEQEGSPTTPTWSPAYTTSPVPSYDELVELYNAFKQFLELIRNIQI